MKTILLIRHGLTVGNLERRYVGHTDMPLCAQGEAQAKALAPELPPCDAVFTSPMLRCRQTADILFGAQKITPIEDLRECHFGVFEGRTADELAHDPLYCAWLESDCTAPIPGGEDVGEFRARCTEAFLRTAQDLPENSRTAFVIHGGCIMAILERLARPERGFYSSYIQNCECVVCAFDGQTLTITGGPLC